MKTSVGSFRSLCAWALLLGASNTFAQTPVDLSGTVYDQDNKPRVGVIVSLGADLVDTTGSDGKWTLQGQIVPVKQAVIRAAHLRWLGGDLITQFDAPTLVSADLFDAAGRRLANLPARMVLSGTQSIALDLPVATGARWLRVRTGSTSTVLSARSGVQAPSIALPIGLARSSGIVDQILSYSFQGQIVTEEQLPSLIQSGLLKWIQDYRVSAPITLDSRVKVDSVWAWFKGGAMAKPIRARMACDTINQLISGRVYTVKSQDPAAVYAFRTWINVYGNGNHLTAISDTIGFTTLFGDIAWTRGFSLGNAFPDGKIVSVDSVEAGNGLNLSLRLVYLDTASHRVKDSVIRAEWDLADGLGWRASANLPPVATAKWNTSGFDTVKLRVMDADSNVAIITKAIKVVNSGSALRLTSGPSDTVITPSDTVAFQLYVRDTSGVAKVIWSYGDGKSDTTKTGSVHAVKHAYPGPSVVLPGKDSTFALTVTVIDSLGGSTSQKLSNVKVANVVLTGTVIGATSGLVNTVYPFAVAVVPAGKKIAHAEWDLGDGQGWRAGSTTGYQAKWLKPGSDTVKVRLTDKDSNTVVLKAAAITITNTKSTLTIGSIVDPFLATPGMRDTIVTPGDTVTFTLNATDVDGIRSLLWNFGDGTPVVTASTGATKHGYPGVGVVPVGQAKRCTLSVKVVDTLGDTTFFGRVAVVKDTNDMPKIVSLPDTFSYITTMHTVKTSGTDLGKIARYEWSTDGVSFSGTLASDTAFRMPDTTTPNYMAYVRAIDGDGNASKVDSIRIIAYGQIIDSRDNQKYKYIKIGTQTWMAQNLNFAVDSSWWYNNSVDSGAKYGRLYSWASAMGLDDSCNSKRCSLLVAPKARAVCPIGWHIPSDSEWNNLINFAGGLSFGGTNLRSSAGWVLSGGDVKGVDSFFFKAMPGGYRYPTPNGYASVGLFGGWWTINAGVWSMGGSASVNRPAGWETGWDATVSVTWGDSRKFAYSLRCIQH